MKETKLLNLLEFIQESLVIIKENDNNSIELEYVNNFFLQRFSSFFGQENPKTTEEDSESNTNWNLFKWCFCFNNHPC